jgi:hypothetical protein
VGRGPPVKLLTVTIGCSSVFLESEFSFFSEMGKMWGRGPAVKLLSVTIGWSSVFLESEFSFFL